MGLFDAIKDALTTDDAERYEAASKDLAKAQTQLEKIRAEHGAKTDPMSKGRIDKAEHAVATAQQKVDELAAKAGVQPEAPAAEAVDTEAREKADADALAAIKEQQRKHAEQKAAAEAAEKAAAEKDAAEKAAALEAQQKAAAEQAAAEAAPAEPLVATEPALREYTVVKGDTLSGIGKRFGVKWRDIAELNNVTNPDLIFPGQVFKIPNA